MSLLPQSGAEGGCNHPSGKIKGGDTPLINVANLDSNNLIETAYFAINK